MITLYHYVHCPFCIRVRLACGYLSLPYESIVLPYDDEKTPVDLADKKMLPIMTFQDGDSMNESLDIIRRLDKERKLSDALVSDQLDQELQDLGKPIHNLCMPYWSYTKEFNESSRTYFTKKKEVKRGPFHLLAQQKEVHLKTLEPLLIKLEQQLTPYYQSSELTLADMMIASHLWGLYILPEFQFSKTLHDYLQGIKEQCDFDYHKDLWLEA